MGTLWTDVRLWPSELDQEKSVSRDEFGPSSQTLSHAERIQYRLPKKEMMLGLAIIIAIVVSAMCLACRYLL
jgi:hypothetical protein